LRGSCLLSRRSGQDVIHAVRVEIGDWNQSGAKTVTVTFTANGCTNTCTAQITVDNTVPDLTCTGGQLTCTTTTAQTHVTVNNPGAAGTGSITFSWAGAGLVSGGNTADATWSQGGSKTVTVTFTANGCSNTCTTSITVDDTRPPCAISPQDTTVDVGGTATLCGPVGNFTYLWSNGSTDRCITVGVGTYGLRVTNDIGCTDSCTATVRETSPGRCWLTGGGQSYDSDGHLHSYGGVINPGCSPTAGGGGNWNDLDHTTGAHFKGTEIQVVQCGNVAGIPLGSSSPKTPFNFIDFQGTGYITGLNGSKKRTDVSFFGHYEDRSEPGSLGQRDTTFKDRYFLRVFTNPANPIGSTVMLVDVDGNSATQDPVAITHGNLQIHISGCDKNALAEAIYREPETRVGIEGVSLPAELTFGAARPNPTAVSSELRYGLPKAGYVSAKLFDVAGRLVRDLGEGPMTAGWHSVSWDLQDEAGQRVGPGMYFARLVVDGKALMRPITVLH